MLKLQDDMIRLSDLIKGLEYETKKMKFPHYYENKRCDSPENHVSNRPKHKYDESSKWMAEIIIEDISNGLL